MEANRYKSEDITEIRDWLRLNGMTCTKDGWVGSTEDGKILIGAIYFHQNMWHGAYWEQSK